MAFILENIRKWLIKEALQSGDCISFLFDTEDILDELIQEMIGSPEKFWKRWEAEIGWHHEAA